MASPNDYGPATLAITQSVGAFQFFLPRLSDVRKANPSDADMAGDVRMGEVAAGALCIGIGAMVSSLSGSPYPAMVAILMTAILICVYETALRGDRPMNPKSAHIGERATDA